MLSTITQLRMGLERWPTHYVHTGKYTKTATDNILNDV